MIVDICPALTATVTATRADYSRLRQPPATQRDRRQWYLDGQATITKIWQPAFQMVTPPCGAATQAMPLRHPSDATEDPSRAAPNCLPRSVADLQACANQP